MQEFIPTLCLPAKNNLKTVKDTPIFRSVFYFGTSYRFNFKTLLGDNFISPQVKAVLGILKQDRHFTRFLTRGADNVKTETLLLCLGFSINKLHAKIQAERCGKTLHLPKTKAD